MAASTFHAMDCRFCRIIAGEQPADLVLDSTDVVAFLDNRPVFKGHVLVMPRLHVDSLVELPDALMSPLMTTVRSTADAMIAALGSQGSFVAINNVVSQSVPHLHVHVVPRTKGDGLRGFFWPRTRYADAAESRSFADRLRAALDG